MEGIEARGPLDNCNGFFGAAGGSEDSTHQRQPIRVSGVESHAAFELRKRLIVFASVEVGLTEKLMTPTFAGIQLNSPQPSLQGASFDRVGRAIEAVFNQQCQGKIAMRKR